MSIFQPARDEGRIAYGILLILVFGFLLRVLVLQQGLELKVERDERAYFVVARQILNNPAQYAEMFRPPLYPAFLAVIFRFAGETRFAVGWVQALLDACNIALLFAITQRLFHRARIGLAAAFLYALYPEAIELTRSWFSEIFFVFLANWGLLLLLDRRKMRAGLKLALAGVCFGLASLAREIIAYFAILVVPLWFWLGAARHWRRALAQTIFFAAGLALIFTPWLARNWQMEKRFLLVSTAGEFNLIKDNTRILKRNLKHAPADAPGVAEMRALPRSKKQVHAALKQQPPTTRATYATQVAWRAITFDPPAWLAAKSISAGQLWSPSTLLTPFTRGVNLAAPFETPLKILAAIYLVAILVFATIGLFFAPGSLPKLWVAFYVLYSLLIFLLTHFQIRYRMPLATVLLPYAAFAMVEWKTWLKPSRRLYAALAVCFVFLWLAFGQAAL